MSDKRCSKCRLMMPDIAEYCPICGQRVSVDVVAYRAASSQTAPTGGNRIFGTVALLVGGLLMGIVLFGLLAAPHSAQSPAFASPSIPFSSSFSRTPMIRDGNGHEITDPAMRQAIESEIQRNGR